uniref:Immunoglobulin V-set domain-containing protein n=1 Tax=Ailuropoda melanoleuca TaxID=9646 RepID=G1L5B2_AILME
MDSPSCVRGWRRKGGLGQPSPLWGRVSVSPWPGVLSSSCFSPIAQPGLTQPPSFSASLGSSTVTCTLSSQFCVGGSYIYWFQQHPGSHPRYLLDYSSDSDKHQDSGVPSRFSRSKDTSANAGLLLLSGLQPKDKADCFWATAHGGGRRRSGSETSGHKNLVSDPQSGRHCMDRHSGVVASAR